MRVDAALDGLGAAHGDVDDALAVETEHHAALHGRRGIVEVHDGPPRAPQREEGTRDDLVARLGQHLDGDVVRDQAPVDQLAQEVEIGLRGRREADLDLLETDAHEFLEHAQLAARVHGLDERLVAIAQIDAAPGGWLADGAGRPGTVGQVDRTGRVILGRGIAQHGSSLAAECWKPPLGRLSLGSGLVGADRWRVCLLRRAAQERESEQAAAAAARRDGAVGQRAVHGAEANIGPRGLASPAP